MKQVLGALVGIRSLGVGLFLSSVAFTASAADVGLSVDWSQYPLLAIFFIFLGAMWHQFSKLLGTQRSDYKEMLKVQAEEHSKSTIKLAEAVESVSETQGRVVETLREVERGMETYREAARRSPTNEPDHASSRGMG